MQVVWSEKADEILSIGSFMPDGIQNWALTRSQAGIAIEKLLLSGIAILGGDVCTIQRGRIFPNGDGWYCDPLTGESRDDFLGRSINKAREYIRTYPAIEGEEEMYFNIVPAN